MIERRTLWQLAGLALLLLAVQALIWWLKPGPSPRGAFGPARSGYTLKDLTYYSYDEDGKPSMEVTSPSLERRENDRSYYIETPHFVLYSTEPETTAPWTGSSRYAWVDRGGDEVRLMGKVDMYREALGASPSAELHTEDATIWPDKQFLQTEKSAHMRDGTTTLSGVGMKADLHRKHIELLDNVHAIFHPNTK